MSKRLQRFKILQHWFSEYQQTELHHRPRTIKDYAFEISYFRKWIESNTDLQDIDDLTHDTIVDFNSALYDKNLKAGIIHHKLAVLNSFFKALYDQPKIYIDLAGVVPLPRLSKTLPANYLTEQEIDTVFKYIEQKLDGLTMNSLEDARMLRTAAIFEMLFATGMRKAECTGLMLNHINYDDGLVEIHEGKGGDDRVVPIGETSLKIIRWYVADARKFFAVKDSTYLFTAQNRSTITGRSIETFIKNLVKDAGIKKNVTVYGIRHSFSTILLQRNANLRYLQAYLGHKCLSSTQRYLHTSDARLKEVYNKCHPRQNKRYLKDNGEEIS